LTLELWFDFSCPFAYLASRRAHTLGVPIDWRPMLLGGVFRGIGAGDGPLASLSPAKAAHNLADMYRWAERFGVPFQMPAGHPMRTVRALRVLLALPRLEWPRAIEGIYAAYWQRGEDISLDPVIAGALAEAGIDRGVVRIAIARAHEMKEELRKRTDEAIALGIFGAPAWILRRGEPILIWGQDRFAWLEAVLGGWNPDTGRPPAGPRPFAPTGKAAPGTAVDVYYDVASPFSYFALTQLGGLAAMGVTPRLVPILLGGLFREIGQADVPLLTFSPPKLAYINREMPRWASWWGIPFDMPAKFPQRTITAQRLLLLAADESFARGARLGAALGRAMWAEQRDLEDDTTLRELLEQEGFPTAWIERTRDPAVKARLVENTTRAREAGVFGVPTFVVHGKAGPQLYWGQDRLDLVADAVVRG
jgi:2-hydroxychromene-2-carboxylate isomerase